MFELCCLLVAGMGALLVVLVPCVPRRCWQCERSSKVTCFEVFCDLFAGRRLICRRCWEELVKIRRWSR